MRLENAIRLQVSVQQRFESYLSNTLQFVHVKEDPSLHIEVSYGVPLGSMLGPVLFTVYMLPLDSIIQRCSIHFQMIPSFEARLHTQISSNAAMS